MKTRIWSFHGNPGNTRRWFILLATAWLGINMVQAYATDLANDEAYYWLYSRALDWGYFDHPPLVAVWIGLGSFVGGELGVRLASIFSQVAALSIVFWALTGEEYRKPGQVTVFFALAFFIPILNVFGFIATPEAPLILFTALFLWGYKRFLEEKSWVNTLWMAVCMAALLYSKYHGILVIGFTFLSNLKLLREPRFYAAAFLGALFFSPHLYWQYTHDWPSVRYHLLERSTTFKWKYLGEYLLNIPLVYNPLLIPLYIGIFRRRNLQRPMHRAYFFIIIGILAFFFFSMRNRHVQPQWTIVVCIPLLILLSEYCFDNFKQATRYLFRIAWIYVPLILLARLAIAVDFLPIKLEFHGKREYALALQEAVPDHHILFQSKYRLPAHQAFYTGRFPVAMVRRGDVRKSQFDLWDWETHFRGQPVFFLDNQGFGRDTVGIYQDEALTGLFIDPYFPVFRVKVNWSPDSIAIATGEFQIIEVELHNQYRFPVSFSKQDGIRITGFFFDKKYRIISMIPAAYTTPVHLEAGEKKILPLRFLMPEPGKAAYFAIGLRRYNFNYPFSEQVSLTQEWIEQQ